jgi:hypothetical protein
VERVEVVSGVDPAAAASAAVVVGSRPELVDRRGHAAAAASVAAVAGRNDRLDAGAGATSRNWSRSR